MGGALMILAIAYYRLEKQPYVIELSAFDVAGKPAKCDASFLNFLKEKIRIDAIRQIANAVTVRSQEHDKYIEVVSRVESLAISDSLSQTSPYLMMIRNVFGIRAQVVSVFLSVQEDSCTIRSAEVISGVYAEITTDNGPRLIQRMASMIVNAIDPFIAVSEAAYDYRTLQWSRAQTFTRIAKGKDTIWYKNLAGVTYLQETDLFDRKLNKSIIGKLNEKARYWFNSALSDDKNFLPSIFNLQNIDIDENGSTYASYQKAIDELMRLHWRDHCSECVARAAQLRLARHDRHRESRLTYAGSEDDLRIARELLEWKVRNHGATRGDLTILARLVEAQETSTYQEYLSTVARDSGPTRFPGVLDDPIAHIESFRP